MKAYYYFLVAMMLGGASIIGSVQAQSPLSGPNFSATEYKKALWMTTRMYGGQRAGDKNTSNGNWLLFGHSLASDGRTFLNDADAGYDLSGGWFDCGDHVKFGHTEFWSAYMLLKGFSEFAPGYDDRYAADYQGYKNANNYSFEGSGHAPNNIPDILEEAKHATDYLIKCTRDNNTFYYQVGEGGPDHTQWVTSAKMQNNPVNTGGQPRAAFKNPADGAMPSLAGAALAIMSRLYRPYDATYADLCLTHAKYAYAYASPRKTQTVGAPGGFYGVNANPLNAYSILLSELYWASKDEAYKTEALAMTVDASSSSANVRGNPFGLDYVNNGDIAVYNLYLLGKTGAEAAFNTIVNTHYIGNVQSDGQFAGGNTGWGPLRYNASAAFVVALWTKRNSITAGAKTFIYSNIDYILGKNSRNYSFIVGFGNGAMHPHHRNVYMSDANSTANMNMPTKNQQHGYMVGGKRNPHDYQDNTNDYRNTEGGIDYNSALVGALAWINMQIDPVNKYKVPDVVTVSPTVTLTAPDNNSTVCAGNSITITATASISSGSISKVNFYNGATLLGSDETSPYSYTWNSPSTGEHTVRAIAVSAEGVSSTEATAVVTVNVLPASPTVSSPITYCLNATASPLSATGTALKWYTDPAAGTGNTTAPTPVTTSTGTTSYYVSQTVNGCEGERAKIDVLVNASPDAPSVSAPLTYCQNETATALTANGTSLKWYTAPSNGTGSSTAPIPATVTAGTTSYYVSQTVNGCEGERATIDVLVNATPDAPSVSTPLTYCQDETATALTADGTSLKWYTAPSSGTGSSTAPIPATTTAGTTSYYVSQTVNGCEGSRAKIDVVINGTPATPSVSTPLTYCQDETATALTANGTSLKWYTTPSNGTGSSTAPIPATATAGTTSYYVSQTVNGCEGSRAKIDVLVNASPAAPSVSTSLTYCQDETATALTANGTSLKWYTAPFNGTGSSTAPIPATATAGTTSYYVSQTVNGCEGSRAKIDVVVNASPVAPSVSTPLTYCQDETATALTANGTSLKWYTTPSNGTGSSTAPTPVTTSTGTTSYYVSQSVSGCESQRAAIDVVVNPAPAATITANGSTTIPEGSSVVLSANTGTGLNYKWLNGLNEVGANPTYSATEGGNYSVEVTNAFGCKVTSTGVTVTIIGNESPSVTISSPTDNAVFTSPATITLTASATDPDGTVSSVTFYNGTTVLETVTASPYTFAWANVGTGQYSIIAVATDNKGAQTTSAAVNITVNANQPSVITITSPTNNSTINGNTVTISVDATDADGSITKVEYFDGNTLIGSSTTTPYDFVWTDPSDGTHVITVKVTDSNGGVTTSDPVTVTVNTNATGILSSHKYGTFMEVYPNPSSEAFRIKPNRRIKQVIMLNMYGETVAELHDILEGQHTEIGRELQDGTYILRVEYVSGIHEVTKLVKIK